MKTITFEFHLMACIKLKVAETETEKSDRVLRR